MEQLLRSNRNFWQGLESSCFHGRVAGEPGPVWPGDPQCIRQSQRIQYPKGVGSRSQAYCRQHCQSICDFVFGGTGHWISAQLSVRKVPAQYGLCGSYASHFYRCHDRRIDFDIGSIDNGFYSDQKGNKIESGGWFEDGVGTDWAKFSRFVTRRLIQSIYASGQKASPVNLGYYRPDPRCYDLHPGTPCIGDFL